METGHAEPREIKRIAMSNRPCSPEAIVLLPRRARARSESVRLGCSETDGSHVQWQGSQESLSFSLSYLSGPPPAQTWSKGWSSQLFSTCFYTVLILPTVRTQMQRQREVGAVPGVGWGREGVMG